MRPSELFGLVIAISTMCIEIDSAPAPLALASARQFLAPMPGYIPVYIRQGDEPLENINVDLAAAFRAYAAKHQLNTGRALNELDHQQQAHAHAHPKAGREQEKSASTHIQKIAPTKKSPVET